MINNIIFDVNKVLRILKPQSVTNFFTKKLMHIYGEKYKNISTREYFNKFFQNDTFKKYDLGLISQAELISTLSEIYNEPYEVLDCILEKRCLKKHNEIFKPMMKLIQSLRLQGKKIFILSNMGKDAADVLRIYLGEENFEDIIFSCDVHMAKPHDEIYEYALNRFNILPHETLFVDDTEENLAPFEKLGVKTYLFKHKQMELCITDIQNQINSN